MMFIGAPNFANLTALLSCHDNIILNVKLLLYLYCLFFLLLKSLHCTSLKTHSTTFTETLLLFFDLLDHPEMAKLLSSGNTISDIKMFNSEEGEVERVNSSQTCDCCLVWQKK